MTQIESIKECLKNIKAVVAEKTNTLKMVLNDLQTEYDTHALQKLQEVNEPLYVLNYFADEPVTEVKVIGTSEPDISAENEIYSRGVVDIKPTDMLDCDDFVTVNADKIYVKRGDKYEPVITKDFV